MNPDLKFLKPILFLFLKNENIGTRGRKNTVTVVKKNQICFNA